MEHDCDSSIIAGIVDWEEVHRSRYFPSLQSGASADRRWQYWLKTDSLPTAAGCLRFSYSKTISCNYETVEFFLDFPANLLLFWL
jgi:hypothetical protein